MLLSHLIKWKAVVGSEINMILVFYCLFALNFVF